jgi:hypothetical protein
MAATGPARCRCARPTVPATAVPPTAQLRGLHDRYGGRCPRSGAGGRHGQLRERPHHQQPHDPGVGLEAGATWEYSLNGGNSWINGSGSSFVLADGSYGAARCRCARPTVPATAALRNTAFAAFTIDTWPAPRVWPWRPTRAARPAIGSRATAPFLVSGLEEGASVGVLDRRRRQLEQGQRQQLRPGGWHATTPARCRCARPTGPATPVLPTAQFGGLHDRYGGGRAPVSGPGGG